MLFNSGKYTVDKKSEKEKIEAAVLLHHCDRSEAISFIYEDCFVVHPSLLAIDSLSQITQISFW